MKAAVIVNPKSGNKDTQKLMQQIERCAANTRMPFDVWLWKKPDDIDALVQKALDGGYDALIAAGGDGTIHEIGSRIIGKELALGIIPAGTGNALAHHLGIPHDIERCFEVLRAGHTVWMDTAQANGRPFLAFLGFGLDAAIIERYASVKKRNILTYIWHSVNKYIGYRRAAYRIEFEGGHHDWKPHMLTVMNISEFGMRARMAPGASVSDGQLDLFAIWVPGWWYLPVLAYDMFRGGLKESRNYRRLRSPRFRLVRTSDGPAQIDGEPIVFPSEIEIEVVPQSLRVIVPAGLTV